MDDDDLGTITCPNCGTACYPIDGQWVCRHCDITVIWPE